MKSEKPLSFCARKGRNLTKIGSWRLLNLTGYCRKMKYTTIMSGKVNVQEFGKPRANVKFQRKKVGSICGQSCRFPWSLGGHHACMTHC